MRTSGILFPVFSLPGKYGIGCFSEEAYKGRPTGRSCLLAPRVTGTLRTSPSQPSREIRT